VKDIVMSNPQTSRLGSITGRDELIIAEALATALIALEQLPDARQPTRGRSERASKNPDGDRTDRRATKSLDRFGKAESLLAECAHLGGSRGRGTTAQWLTAGTQINF
jgi:hypothetical protein